MEKLVKKPITLYENDNITIDTYAVESGAKVRISLFEDGHWSGEQVFDYYDFMLMVDKIKEYHEGDM